AAVIAILIDAGVKSVIDTDPLLCPLYTRISIDLLRLNSTISTSPKRTVTDKPELTLPPTATAVTPSSFLASSTIFCTEFNNSCLFTSSTTNCNFIYLDCRLPNSYWHTLSIFATHTNPPIKFQIIANHAYLF